MEKLTVKQVKAKLQTIEHKNDPFLVLCQNDERKGVQKALKQWEKRQAKQQKLIELFKKMNHYEENARNTGYQAIAGIDEVGRGPLAGPVVSAAVILDPNKPAIIGLNDSKKLSLKKRLALYETIYQRAAAVKVGIVTSSEIDRMNILEASKLAMQEAFENLAVAPDYLLIDAVEIKSSIPQESLVKGDMKSNSIAAASIIAKVTRDNMMKAYAKDYPNYGFSSNMGYGTKEHIEGLKHHGATPIHRHSFSPVGKYL